MKKNQNGFGAVEILIIIAVLAIVGFIGWRVYSGRSSSDNTSTAESINTPVPEASDQTADDQEIKQKNDILNDGYSGTLQAVGYPYIVKTKEDYTCVNDCKQVDYVFFKMNSASDPKFLEWVEASNGNAFVQEKAIGMGCLADGQISYYNRSDSDGPKQYTIPTNDTTKIMTATSDKPVTLELQRLQLTGGSGASICYSHITTFKVLQ